MKAWVLTIAMAVGTTTAQAAPALRVGMDPTYFPMGFTSTQGRLEGFDVLYADALGKKLGRSVEIVKMDFDHIVDAVAGKQIALGISAIEVAPTRSDVKLIEYYAMPEALVAKAGKGLSANPDLSTRTVGTVSVSAARTVFHLKKNHGEVKDVQAYPVERKLFEALDLDKLDAVVVHLPTAKKRVDASAGQLVMLEPAVTHQPVGIAVARDDRILTDQVLKAVVALKMDGTTDRLAKEFFGPLIAAPEAESH